MYQRLLLTGGAGMLGAYLRPRLRALCAELRVTDRVDLGSSADGEDVRIASLENRSDVDALVDGVDCIVHFGGVWREQWEELLNANVIGMYNLYEAARAHGVKRIVYASSNHATGFYGTDQVITPNDPVRPDSLYGLTKTWGENLARLYFDRYGIETACLRIGSAMVKPNARRMLASWLSRDDLERLVRACLVAPRIGNTIVYGVSNNAASWWDNRSASHLGYRPLDSAEDHRAAIEAAPPLAADDPNLLFQGGSFVLPPIG